MKHEEANALGNANELQAALALSKLALYLYTLTTNQRSYHWMCYAQWMKNATHQKQSHIELDHPGSIHFIVKLKHQSITLSNRIFIYNIHEM